MLGINVILEINPLMPWPGVKVVTLSPAGQALLGTLNGCCLAWMVLQHREFGIKVVASTTVWQDEYGNINLLQELAPSTDPNVPVIAPLPPDPGTGDTPGQPNKRQIFANLSKFGAPEINLPSSGVDSVSGRPDTLQKWANSLNPKVLTISPHADSYQRELSTSISVRDFAKRVPDPNEPRWMAACNGVQLNKAIQDAIYADNTHEPRQYPQSPFQHYNQVRLHWNPTLLNDCGNVGDLASVLVHYGMIYDGSFSGWSGWVSQAHTCRKVSVLTSAFQSQRNTGPTARFRFCISVSWGVLITQGYQPPPVTALPNVVQKY